MPGMRLFGRRCSLATDDFFFIGLIDFIIFLPWLAWVPVIYASFLKQRSSCHSQDTLLLLDISLPGLCILFLMNWLVSASFIYFSSRGTISKPEPRRHIVTLVYVKLFVSALDVAWAILGTVILYHNSYCDIFGVGLLIKVCTTFQWIAAVVRLAMIIVFYDLKHSKHTKDITMKDYFTHPVRKGTCKKWSFRVYSCFMICTTASEERKQALRAASELLALLSCGLDLVASDVIAGMLLVRRKYLRQWEAESLALDDDPPITNADDVKIDKFPTDDFEPWMNFKEATHFLKLGMGVFGYFWFVFKHLACGFCILFRHLTCCFPFRKRASIVKGDNCCGCDVAGLQLTTNLLFEDLVLVSFKDGVYEVPFFVTYDHQTSSIVITARGTMSMNDVLTDFTAGFGTMDDPGCPPGSLCHDGMLCAARLIKKKLEDTNILEDAFRERPNYQLVITGHSLGAAVATVLTVLFKHHYPNVRCYAFAPCPTVNKAALSYVERNVFTIIYGNDVVCFINYENVKKLVLEMMECLQNCNFPKYKIFMSNCDTSDDVESKEQCANTNTNSAPTNGVTKPQNLNGVGNGHSEVPAQSDPQTGITETHFVAGKIVHIYPRKDGYRLKIRTTEHYRKIKFRPKMIFDHVPIFIEKALEDLSKHDVLDESSLKIPLKKE